MITINNVIFVSTEEWKQTLIAILVVYPHKFYSILAAYFFKCGDKHQGDAQIQGCASTYTRPYGLSEGSPMVSAGTE